MNSKVRVSTIHRILQVSTAWTVLLAFCLTGCDSKPDTSDVVSAKVSPPPLSNQENVPADPPGSMELPTGSAGDHTVSRDSNSESPASAGLVMPEVENSPSIQPQYATWKEFHDAATSTGKVTVVDVWSLVCEPCVKEFPGLVRLHQAMGDSVACMSISIDYDGRKSKPPESYEPQVTAFVNAKGASFANFISRTPDEDIYAAAELDSIPAVLIFDAQGKLIKKFVDAGDGVGFTYDKDVIPFVKSLQQ